MGLQKYRADTSETQPDGAIVWSAKWMGVWAAKWMGGPSLSKIEKCRIANRILAPRMVYITGEPDTYFSQPAAFTYRGKTVRGFVTGDDGNLVFHAMDGQIEDLRGAGQ